MATATELPSHQNNSQTSVQPGERPRAAPVSTGFRLNSVICMPGSGGCGRLRIVLPGIRFPQGASANLGSAVRRFVVRGRRPATGIKVAVAMHLGSSLTQRTPKTI